MATATIARPTQPPRQRDRAPRPGLAKRINTGTMDGVQEPASKKRKLDEPYVRTSDYILRKHRGKQPSLIIHLHQTHFRFDSQDGSFAYDSPMKFVLLHLKRQTVPHEMLEELLANNIPFYDGCLIVEVRNHRTAAGKDKGQQDSRSGASNKFSMHNYNEHVTPSPLAPYPAKAKMEEQSEQSSATGGDMAAPEQPDKGKEQDGPKITTLVLHPTELTKHHELLILANTPASEALRGKKKSGDASTPSSAQPPTPSHGVPPTPLGIRGPLSQTQKMCLEEGDFYSFQSEMLVASEPPLYLEPVKSPEEAERVLQYLSSSLHTEPPPSPKTRKRTTAEMAADDAQAAEAERRMLLMDDRIKPSARAGAGAPANENQGAAASLGFSRFKTLEMVRQKHEEQERIRKEEEGRVAAEKKQNEEQNAVKQQQMMRANQQRELLLAQQQQTNNRQMLQQRQQEQMRAQQIAQAQAQAQAQIAAARDHAHPQNNQMIPNNPQNFQHQASLPQGSPITRQQTPMMNSSPMLPNGSFPMVPTSSQGAGSPPRPTSAAMQSRNVSMARQVSQQQHNSQNNTPQMRQGTPSMAQAMPNRQMTQTPRMPPGSPAGAMHGTPNSANIGTMPTPHMGQPNQLSQEQLAMLQAQHARNQQATGMHAGSSGGMQNMTPDQIQQIQRQAMINAQQRGMDPRIAAQQAQRMHMARQQQLMAQRMQQMGGQAGSPTPGMHPQATPQMHHAHPQNPQMQQPQQHPGMSQPNQQGGDMQQQASHQQTQMAAARAQQLTMQRQQAQQAFRNVATQYGGWQNIPSNVVPSLPQTVQHMLGQQRARQQQLLSAQAQRAQMLAQANGQGGQGGGQGGQVGGDQQQVPAGQPNPAYMQALRNHQASLAQAQAAMQQQGQGGGGHNGNMGMGMPGNMNMGQNGMQAGHNNNNLDQHFANMQHALNQQQQQRGGQQQQ